MKNYEITFITLEEQQEKPVKAIIESLGGRILNIAPLGQKNFAYPIKKQKNGFYTTVSFEIEAEKVVEVNKKLALEDEILRFLIVAAKPLVNEVKPVAVKAVPKATVEAKPAEIKPEKEEVAEEAPKTPKKAAAKVKPAKKEKKAEKPAKPSQAAKELTESLEEPASEAERMEALDKKLEELLKE